MVELWLGINTVANIQLRQSVMPHEGSIVTHTGAGNGTGRRKRSGVSSQTTEILSHSQREEVVEISTWSSAFVVDYTNTR
jgi:hypothetical protein